MGPILFSCYLKPVIWTLRQNRINLASETAFLGLASHLIPLRLKLCLLVFPTHEIPDPFSISGLFNASYAPYPPIICHLIFIGLKLLPLSIKGLKDLFIEALFTITPQMLLCCYINNIPYALDQRHRVMAGNKECCHSNRGATAVFEGQTVGGTPRDNKINHIASREVSDLKHLKH